MREVKDISVYFADRRLAIATMHGKEQVISPILKKKMGVKTFVPDKLNTDSLGTFTGEVERKYDPIETLRRKCQMALEAYDCELAIATEGSFGSHPEAFFAHANDELILLMDKRNQLEVIAREITTETNFNGKEIETEDQLREFAHRVLFPSHRIILRNENNKNDVIIKGIDNWRDLLRNFQEIYQRYGIAYAETDMRAMYNPTRMSIISRVTQKLVDKLYSLCPQCSAPGFSVSKVMNGLPCMLCLQPTRSALSHISVCQLCQYERESIYPNEKKFEDPIYCDQCNP